MEFSLHEDPRIQSILIPAARALRDNAHPHILRHQYELVGGDQCDAIFVQSIVLPGRSAFPPKNGHRVHAVLSKICKLFTSRLDGINL